MDFNMGIVTVRYSASHSAASTTAPLLLAVLLTYNRKARPKNTAVYVCVSAACCLS
jgi:hypothetical protein